MWTTLSVSDFTPGTDKKITTTQVVTAQQLTYVSVHRASVSSFALAVDKDWQKEEPRNTDTCLLSMMTMHLCHLVLRNHHWHTKMRNPKIIKWPAREKIGMSCRNMNLINPEIWLRCKNPLHLIGFGPCPCWKRICDVTKNDLLSLTREKLFHILQ